MGGGKEREGMAKQNGGGIEREDEGVQQRGRGKDREGG